MSARQSSEPNIFGARIEGAREAAKNPTSKTADNKDQGQDDTNASDSAQSQQKKKAGRHPVYTPNPKWGKDMKKVGFNIPVLMMNALNDLHWEKKTTTNGLILMALEKFLEEGNYD